MESINDMINRMDSEDEAVMNDLFNARPYDEESETIEEPTDEQ